MELNSIAQWHFVMRKAWYRWYFGFGPLSGSWAQHIHFSKRICGNNLKMPQAHMHKCTHVCAVQSCFYMPWLESWSQPVWASLKWTQIRDSFKIRVHSHKYYPEWSDSWGEPSSKRASSASIFKRVSVCVCVWVWGWDALVIWPGYPPLEV